MVLTRNTRPHTVLADHRAIPSRLASDTVAQARFAFEVPTAVCMHRLADVDEGGEISCTVVGITHNPTACISVCRRPQTVPADPTAMLVRLMSYHNIVVMFAFIMLPLQAYKGRGHKVTATKTKQKSMC